MTVTSVPLHHLTPSLHGRFLKKSAPQWLLNAPSERRAALKHSDAQLPQAYLDATPAQRKHLHDYFTASFTAQTELDQTMADLQDIDTFAEPLLRKALKDQHGVVLDVRKTWVSLRKATKIGLIEVGNFEYLKISLLEAAKHNFEASEAEEGAFHHSSGFKVQGATPDTFTPLTINLKVHQFLTLCRSLDIGARYQTHIKAFLQPTDATKAATLRQQFIANQKATMRAAAELALLQKDIDADELAMVISVIDGEVFPQLRGKPVWFCDLSVMKRRLTGCVVFSPCEKYRYPDQVIVYVPHDQKHSMKRFTYEEMRAYFKERFTAADTPSPKATGPTTYQKFFSQFVPYSDHPYYFGQFTKDGETSWASKFASIVPTLSEVLDVLTPFPVGITNPAPLPKAPQLVEADPYLNVKVYRQKDQGLWGDNLDLWDYLFDRSCTQSINDAAAHAVPTADVDARVRAQKIAGWLNIGMFAATFFASFVPVLGEITLAFMAGQLLNEVFEGSIEWAEGDRKAAKAHLIDLAENLAQLALFHAAGKGVGKLLAIKPPPFVEDLHPVTLPNGQTRLWKPDLSPYKSAVKLPDDARPNALGQYEINGKTYVRWNGDLYEKTLDPTVNKWRIKHPDDPEAYQPLLEHNNAGAWRHIHERPLEWDRLTLLRRLGHRTDAFSDEVLRTIGAVSGVQDEQLYKVHADGLAIPAALDDTLERFSVDRQVSEVIEQIRHGSGAGSHFECVLPLTTELPRWPAGRVLEVFDGPEPWGASHRYGVTPSASDAGVTIKLTRREVQTGKLAEKVLAQMSAEETSRLLGSESGWNGLTQEEVFNERLADHALKRQRALFESFWRSNRPEVEDPGVLGRRYPSLPHQAVDEVMGAATPLERSRLKDTGKVPRRLDDLARISLQQHRLNRAISGLHRENLASLDSDRLALHSLERLPGWPGGLRLELRSDSLQGPLLDHIGAEDAAVRKYLVKDGDSFQALDERGVPLHSRSLYSRNFYQAILHALPDNSRNALGIPSTAQGELLKQTLADYASSHRSEMASILGQRVPRSRPSLRLADGRLGYQLSGRGAGPGAETGEIERLIMRVQDIYTGTPEYEARFFVRAHLNNGEHPQQIFNLLANRQRELDVLRSALDHWAGSDSDRLREVGSIIRCWRSGLHRSATPFSTLSILGESGLPELNADFSHVRNLRVSGAALLGDQGAALMRQFPNVRRLELMVSASTLRGVVEQVASLPDITELVLMRREYDVGSSPELTPEVMQSINRMTQLEQLTVSANMDRLDVSGLVNLRRLEVSGSLATWPEGVLDLEHLESLILSDTQISSIAPQMFTGHERLWRGMRMSWGRFEPQAFRQAYEHVHDNPAHLVDEEVMVRSYANGSLYRLTDGNTATTSDVLEAFRLQQIPGNEQIERLDTLWEESRELAREVREWSQRDPVGSPIRGQQYYFRSEAANRILASWRQGLGQRLAPGTRPGPSTQTAAPLMRLDLSGTALVDLPSLPAAGFSHVSHLDLARVRVPLTELGTFLGRFSGVEHLNLSDNDLTSLPAGLSEMTSLRSLDFSGNELVVTPTIQTRLNQLTSLTSLNLQLNPVRTLDISHLPRLATLDVGHTAIRDWPAGALESPALERLDLSHSAVTTIPQAALTGHDPLLANTNLRGCRLTAAALAHVRAIGQRMRSESPLGIPREFLEQGRTGGYPEYFPMGAEQNPNLMLPLPLSAESAATPMTAAARMQRLDPDLDAAQAVARIEALSRDGLSALEIEARLVTWEEQQRQWIQALNEWIDVQGVRRGSRWISALDRRRAAERLLSNWRYSLRERLPLRAPVGQLQLDLSWLTLGDLPALPSPLAHIRELNLRSIMMTEQGSNEFLRAFPNIETLILDENGLSVLPDPVSEFRSLRRLEAMSNALRDAAALRQQLLNMPLLESLNLNDNRLAELDVSGMSQLQTLNLQDNALTEWPAGVFQAPRLRTLNLRNNWIETLPYEMENGLHQTLMAGTDLSGNTLLSGDCEYLRSYLQSTGHGLGFTLGELDAMIEDYEAHEGDGSDSSDSPFVAPPPFVMPQPVVARAPLGADVHPEIEPPQVQRDRWLTGVVDGSERYQAWEELRADPDSADFFFTLSQLRNTKDFQRNPADVNARVWRILDALYENRSLRSDVFARARAGQPAMTCGDGRILVFNDLETAVYEYQVLSTVTPAQEGAELFRLARRMSRLDAVESIAEGVTRARRAADPAEIRLAYRIGLSQRLDLPNQPQSMRYGNLANVSAADLNDAYSTIIENERGDAFANSLVQRTYWVDYLKRTYPAEFNALADDIALQIDALDDRYPDAGEEYLREYAELGRRRAERETALAIELTARERTRLGL